MPKLRLSSQTFNPADDPLPAEVVEIPTAAGAVAALAIYAAKVAATGKPARCSAYLLRDDEPTPSGRKLRLETTVNLEPKPAVRH